MIPGPSPDRPSQRSLYDRQNFKKALQSFILRCLSIALTLNPNSLYTYDTPEKNSALNSDDEQPSPMQAVLHSTNGDSSATSNQPIRSQSPMSSLFANFAHIGVNSPLEDIHASTNRYQIVQNMPPVARKPVVSPLRNLFSSIAEETSDENIIEETQQTVDSQYVLFEQPTRGSISSNSSSSSKFPVSSNFDLARYDSLDATFEIKQPATQTTSSPFRPLPRSRSDVSSASLVSRSRASTICDYTPKQSVRSQWTTNDITDFSPSKYATSPLRAKASRDLSASCLDRYSRKPSPRERRANANLPKPKPLSADCGIVDVTSSSSSDLIPKLKNFDPPPPSPSRPLARLPYHTKLDKNAFYWMKSETLAALLNGDYSSKISNYVIIDCRSQYEFDGGHITGATNFETGEDVIGHFITKNIVEKGNLVKGAQDIALIFHCEFSERRGPTALTAFREADRALNAWPQLFYPDVYCLEGGYSNFYQSFPVRCMFCDNSVIPVDMSLNPLEILARIGRDYRLCQEVDCFQSRQEACLCWSAKTKCWNWHPPALALQLAMKEIPSLNCKL